MSCAYYVRAFTPKRERLSKACVMNTRFKVLFTNIATLVKVTLSEVMFVTVMCQLFFIIRLLNKVFDVLNRRKCLRDHLRFTKHCQ